MGELNRPLTGLSLRTGAGLLAGVTLLFGVTACTGTENDKQTPTPSTTSAKPQPTSTPSSTRGEHVEGESVTEAPKPVNGTVLLSTAGRTGNATLALGEKVGKGRLAVQVNCQGKGTLTVSVTPVGLDFPLTCVEGEVSSTYNEIHLKRPRDEAAIQIAAPSTVRWALTVEQ
ncbi:hypothetical protein ACPB9E_36255 [Streptomyces exfoliatus]|uniref:hypothetical protein n=1 Tax=Streptomyces exfoliatus TaxID=1905 RepID=UPI003C2BF780